MGQFFQMIHTSPKLFSHEIGAYGENRLNGSKIRAFFLFPKWRRPPSWISSKCHVVQLFEWYVLIKYGENRLRFKSYSTFPVSKMAVAAIFDLVQMPYGTIFSNDIYVIAAFFSWNRGLWWKSIKQFNGHIRLYNKIQDGGDRHLGNRKSAVTFEP